MCFTRVVSYFNKCEAARPAASVGGTKEGITRVLAFDMGELASLEEQAAKAVSEFGRVNILALNAGVSNVCVLRFGFCRGLMLVLAIVLIVVVVAVIALPAVKSIALP